MSQRQFLVLLTPALKNKTVVIDWLHLYVYYISDLVHLLMNFFKIILGSCLISYTIVSVLHERKGICPKQNKKYKNCRSNFLKKKTLNNKTKLNNYRGGQMKLTHYTG